MTWICCNLLRSHFLFCWPWWPFIVAGSQPPTIWQAPLVAKIRCMWVHLLKYDSVSWSIFEVSGGKELIVSARFLLHVGWFMFQRFWVEILIGFWFMLPYIYIFLGAANWKGSHWILVFLNGQLVKFEILIDMILQSFHWSMVFRSILQSMVRSELFHPWGASWSMSFW